MQPTERTSRRPRARKGSVVLHKPTGRYQVRYTDHVENPVDGIGKRRSGGYYDTREDADRALEVILGEQAQGVPQPSGQYTLARWLPVWLESIPDARLRARSRTRYQALADSWCVPELELAGRQLHKLRPEDIGRALNRMGRRGHSASTQQSALSILRMALDSAQRSGHVGRNVARLVESPRPEPRPIMPPRGAELEQLAAAMTGDPLEALWRLAMHAGLRQGEALGLRWRDVNLDAGLVRVTGTLQYATRSVGKPKSRAGYRTLPITAEWTGHDLVAVLRAHRDRDGLAHHRDAFVFATTVGTPHHARNILERWYTVCRRAGVKRYRMHDLRHAATTAMLARGIAPGLVSGYMGHSSLTMTDRYTHTTLTDLAWIEPEDVAS